MKNTYRVGWISVLVLALLIPIAGCGGGDDDSTVSTRSPEEREEALQAQRERIEGFGLEATGSEAKLAESTLTGYLTARANGEWKKACSYEVKSLRQLFGRMTQAQKGEDKPKSKGCPGYMEMATRKLTAAERENLAEVKVKSVRVEDGQGYILYTNSTGDEYAMSIKREGGQWKVTGDLGTALTAQ